MTIDRSRARASGSEQRAAPTHRMGWYPADHATSPLRGELALEGNHLVRLAWRELLDALWLRGGYIARSEIAGALLLSREDAEQALSRLLESGRFRVTEDGRVYNDRVLRDLAAEQTYRAEQRERGKAGARSRWQADGERHPDGLASAKQVHGPPPPSPAPAPTPAPPEGARANHRSRIVTRKPPRTGRNDGALSRSEEGDDQDGVEAKVEQLRGRLRDRSTDARNLRAIVVGLPWPEVDRIAHEAWARFRDNLVANPTAYFVTSCRTRAQTLGIQLRKVA